jgi:uncharacterized protein (DUF1330 family)/quinol monooxygenase YgiN
MNIKKLLLGAACGMALAVNASAQAESGAGRYIRLAELEIEPSQMAQFTAAINEGIAAAVRTEPGVLALYAVTEKDRPNHVRVFEMYTSAAAYEHHLATPHFVKFRDSTLSMVRSRTLLDANALALGAKPEVAPSSPPASPASPAHAAAATRPAYYLADFELTDAEAIKPYSAAVESTFQPYGGRYVIRGGAATQLEGEAPRGRLVMIAFDSMAQAQAWYDSPAYDKLKPIRHRAGNSRVRIVEGLPGNEQSIR